MEAADTSSHVKIVRVGLHANHRQTCHTGLYYELLSGENIVVTELTPARTGERQPTVQTEPEIIN